MRWEDEIGNNDSPTFRTDVTLPGNICFAALRLRAKLAAQTGNPTHVPPGRPGGLRFRSCLLSRISSTRIRTPHPGAIDSKRCNRVNQTSTSNTFDEGIRLWVMWRDYLGLLTQLPEKGSRK